MRLGVFGGSFDPIHHGHLILAEMCREHAALDEVVFVPAAVPPHKRSRQLAAAKHRLEMLQLAVGGHAPFRVSTLELDRGGVSYTVETLAALRGQRPEAELYFLMGADSLQDFPTWREPGRICQLAAPLVVRRGGAAEPDFAVLSPFVSAERLEAIRRLQFEMPAIEISSSDLRRAVAAGRSIRFRTPRAVERYIATHGLYRGGAGA